MKQRALPVDTPKGVGTDASGLYVKEGVSLVRVDTGEPVLLRAEEVARLLQIGRTMTFQLIAKGDLPVIRIGRAVRVPRSELELWIRQQTFTR